MPEVDYPLVTIADDPEQRRNPTVYAAETWAAGAPVAVMNDVRDKRRAEVRAPGLRPACARWRRWRRRQPERSTSHDKGGPGHTERSLRQSQTGTEAAGVVDVELVNVGSGAVGP